MQKREDYNILWEQRKSYYASTWKRVEPQGVFLWPLGRPARLRKHLPAPQSRRLLGRLLLRWLNLRLQLRLLGNVRVAARGRRVVAVAQRGGAGGDVGPVRVGVRRRR